MKREAATTKVVLLGLPALVVVGLLIAMSRVATRLRRATVAAGYLTRRLAAVEGHWVGTGEMGSAYLDDRHPCAADLDLFGHGSLYERLWTAGTAPGRDALADWLLTPVTPDQVRQRQAAVIELTPRIELREALAVLAAEVPHDERFAALAEWGSWPALMESAGVRALVITAGTLTIGTLVACFLGAGVWPLLVALALQGGLAWALRRQVDAVLGRRAWRLPSVLTALRAVLARLEAEQFLSPGLRRWHAELAAGGIPASRRLRRLAQLAGWSQLATLLGWGPQLALAVEAWRRGFGPQCGRWLTALGETEAAFSLAAYAFENPDDPMAEVVDGEAVFEGDGMGHPLLPQPRNVRNDVRLGTEAGVLVVSGSNMSGKSTLLRAAGVNAVLALAGAPVRARRLRLTVLRVGATLRVQDSLAAGRSRFFAEALRVRQLLDLARGPVPLLFLLDELFAGTGSHDRRAGAEAVTRRLLDHGAIGLITTHDLAVTELADRLAPRARNVHFEDHTQGGMLAFDYILRPGVARGSNGVALLRAIGIEI